MTTNTERSFKDKWYKNPDLAFEATLDEKSDINQWILSRNGFTNLEELKVFLSSKSSILDAGCGNGRVTALLASAAPTQSKIVGIDLVAADIASKNLEYLKNVSIYSMDLLADLTEIGKFDFIYCQEVLHHTKDPRRAFNNLVQLLNDKGEIAIYVYKKKAPVREFVDDYIRERIVNLDYFEAIEVNKRITELAKVLSEINTEITVPNIDILEIPAGTYSIQRFIYHFFMKCFWNNQLTFDENVAINYDWYHPQDCSRHTMDEIRMWYLENNLTILHEFEDFYGITVRGKKQI